MLFTSEEMYELIESTINAVLKQSSNANKVRALYRVQDYVTERIVALEGERDDTQGDAEGVPR